MTDHERDPAADAIMVAAQRARMDDPQTSIAATARVKAAGAGAKGLQLLANTQFARLRATTGIQGKIHWLHKMADTFGAAVGPHAACGPGCDACCHLPVTISSAEAKFIAAKTGAALAAPGAFAGVDLAHVGRACPFLAERRCSIYEHRPLPCRVQYSMDADDLLCHAVPGHFAEVPYANASQLTDVQTAIHMAAGMADPISSLGDIRDFFPNGLQK